MNYLLTVLFSAAITVVFNKGSIFNALRAHGPDLWREFARCPLCVGVWVGGGVTWLASSRGLLQTVFPLLFTVLALGALTGCAALLFVRVVDWFESATVERDNIANFIEEMPKHAERIMLFAAEQQEKQRQERAQIRAERARAAHDG